MSRWLRSAWLLPVILTLGLVLPFRFGQAADPVPPRDAGQGNASSAQQNNSTPIKDENVKQAQDLPLAQPNVPTVTQTAAPAPAPAAPPPTAPASPQAAVGSAEIGPRETGVTQTAGVSSGVQGGQTTQNLATTDAGDLLSKSVSALGVETQKRSPIANESRVRGQKLGEVLTYADGQYFFPARQDLDTFLSKVDSGSIKDVLIFKGPYSARYGPGLSFIDIETEGAPFSKAGEGYKFSGRSVYNYKTNGQQMYGRQMIAVSDEGAGIRLSYGQRIGNDYVTGSGFEEPASYNVRDLEAVVGYKLSKNNSIEFGYLRLDHTVLEFPGQIFDTNFLITDAYRTRFISRDQDFFDLFSIDGYYNRSSMKGDAQRTGKKRLIDLNALIGFQGFTDIDQASGGYRAAVTWGKPNEPQYTIGTDLRIQLGSLNEQDTLFNLPCAAFVNFPVPPSQQTTVGIFAEHARPVNESVNLKVGARVDWVNMNMTHQSNPPVSCTTLSQTLGRFESFERDFALALAYGTLEYKITKELTLTTGFGTAERPPTQTELYAVGPFLATLQQGATTVLGNPGLNPEHLYQVDLGFRGQYDVVRFGANGFYALIEDYITYQPFSAGAGFVKLPTFGNPALADALTVKFINTNLASLSGFEAFTETDFTDWLTPFATIAFVEGRDLALGSGYVVDSSAVVENPPLMHSNNKPLPPNPTTFNKQEPLPSIAPLESRLGLRFHQAKEKPDYGFELSARLVARQDRAATSLKELPSAGFTVWDLRAFWQVNKTVLLTSGVENLFDRNYREHLDLRTGGLGVFQPGVNGYFGLELRY